MTLPLCENCGKPAAFTWTLASGQEAVSCDRCRPASGIAARPVGAAAATTLPLTVAQAGMRENVSIRTIHRWLPALAAAEGAWKAGAEWRIHPDALDARRAAPRPARAPQRQRPKRRTAKRAAPADSGWPA